jgi:hypothetical protein
MNIETVLTCPLNSVCEEIKDNKIHRCRAYIEIEGSDPQTGEAIKDKKCSIFEWQPILLLEIARTNRGQTAAIESFRNETVEQANTTNTILLAAANKQQTMLVNPKDISIT